MTSELGRKIKNVYGLGLKIVILYFLALSAMAVKNCKRCRRRRKNFLSAVGDFTFVLHKVQSTKGYVGSGLVKYQKFKVSAFLFLRRYMFQYLIRRTVSRESCCLKV